MSQRAPENLSKTGATGYSVRVAIIIGFVLSLSMAFFDITKSILSEPSGLSSFLLVLPPLAAIAIVLFLIYAILWFFVVSPLVYFFKLEPVPLAISFAFFLANAFILSLVHILPKILWSKDLDLLPILTLVISSLLISIIAYIAIKYIIHISNYRNTLLILSLALPFLFAETMVLVWLHVYLIESFLSVQSLLLNVGYILIVLLTLGLFYYRSQPFPIMKLLTVFMVLVVLSPLLTLFTVKLFKDSSQGFKDSNHRIKHVILITVDTLRADVLSSYKSKQSVFTPNIDQLAKDGILFKKAISPAPWTLPSFASIMTGLSPSVHMATKRESKLPDNLQTLAEYMYDANYYTAAIGYNWYLSPNFNISQGFIEYNFFPKSMGNTFGSQILKLFPNDFFNLFLTEASTRDLTKLAVKWLESNHEEDFFLWLHYYDPHVPYIPPADYLPKGEPPPAIGRRFAKQSEVRGGYFVPSFAEREWIRKLYEGEVRYVDENIGELITTLKRLNLYDESLIVFTSDHGEEFWEHDSYEHGHTLYNEVLQVPLLIKLPVSASRGQVDTVVSTQSVMPTVLDLCGINYDSGRFSADSLSTLWGSNTGSFNEQPIISTGLLYYEDRESVIFDGLKYIHFLLTDREELYDLTRDPSEQTSVVRLSPEKADRAREILGKHKKIAIRLREHYRTGNVEKVKLDKKATQDLKSLGYIQ
ncbi:MAG TPA: sulfatase-like hydrolase/transferase [Thermodesulfobacteriota bacterium]|nr:sulfatase-like hydrolase/transferase [Thermodesulfobacteriota bacterium]